MKNIDEYWVSISGYENLYEVSSLGNVRSIDHAVIQKGPYGPITRLYIGKVLKPRAAKNGYLYIHLSKQGRRGLTKKNHRLVAENMIENPFNKPQVNHIDGDKENNKLENLERCTSSENLQHAHDTGLKYNRFGDQAHNYRGDIEVLKNGAVIDIIKGHRDALSKGFTSCGIGNTLHGRQKTHRGCTFRIRGK